jgi:hypothetical protein
VPGPGPRLKAAWPRTCCEHRAGIGSDGQHASVSVGLDAAVASVAWRTPVDAGAGIGRWPVSSLPGWKAAARATSFGVDGDVGSTR